MPKISLPAFPWEKIAAIPRPHRIGICAVVFLLLGGGFFYFIYMPKTVEIEGLKKSYSDLQTRVAKAKKDAENLEKYRKQYKEAQGKFKLALQLLPDKKEIPSLLEGISRSGRQSGLEFLLFKPGKEIRKEFYAEIPVQIEVIGGYHNLAVFFAKVAQLPRIVNISNLNIKGTSGVQEGHGALKASCAATTYQFVEPKKAEPKNGKAKKGKKR
ncbi:MAG: type 4a pilus biogenesis protein PilO [Thermodesulfobacteriota bacterium]|nr:type 4a pilus biogenesis protein PilO [Thermodesulfobacteriota bacterium]